MPERVYLDHAASAPLLAEAADAMAAVWRQPGNPSSLHTAGRAARRQLEESRESLAECLGCRPADVVFTSGGTEANNPILLGHAGARPGGPGWRSARPSLGGRCGGTVARSGGRACRWPRPAGSRTARRR